MPSERIPGQAEASSSSRPSRPSERASGHTQPLESILGPVVVVTGANRGLGFAILEELLERDGVKVVFATYRSTNKPFLDIAHKYGNGHNGKFVRIVQMEMKDPLRIKEGIEQINSGLDALVKGGILSKPMINTLINNAGIMEAAVVNGKLVGDKLGVHPLNADDNAYLEHFQVNTVAPITITSQLKRLLDESVDEPRVIFISSTISSMTEFAQLRSHQNVAYQNSKAALNSYMAILSKIKKEKPIDEAIEQLRVAYPELRDYYDHPEKDRSHLEFKQWIVLSLCPGWVETDMGNLADRTKSSPTDAKTAAARVVTAISSMSMDDSGSFYSLFFYTKEQIKGKKLAF